MIMARQTGTGKLYTGSEYNLANKGRQTRAGKLYMNVCTSIKHTLTCMSYVNSCRLRLYTYTSALVYKSYVNC